MCWARMAENRPVTISRLGLRAMFAQRLSPYRNYRKALERIASEGDEHSAKIAEEALQGVRR